MIKAIETQYKGYRFRSRLEARWAVFFDALGIEWQYETEGFEMEEGGRYLPDFFLRVRPGHAALGKFPGAGYWVEIKGEMPTFKERLNMQLLCLGTKHHGYICHGIPGDATTYSFNLWEPKDGVLGHRSESDVLAWTAIVMECMTVPWTYERFEEAVRAAKGARFEHGENGA